MKIKTDLAKLLTSKKCAWTMGILLFFFSIQVFLFRFMLTLRIMSLSCNGLPLFRIIRT